jgi:hypothetical protein
VGATSHNRRNHVAPSIALAQLKLWNEIVVVAPLLLPRLGMLLWAQAWIGSLPPPLFLNDLIIIGSYTMKNNEKLLLSKNGVRALVGVGTDMFNDLVSERKIRTIHIGGSDKVPRE